MVGCIVARVHDGAYVGRKCTVCDAKATHYAKAMTSGSDGTQFTHCVNCCPNKRHQRAAKAEAETRLYATWLRHEEGLDDKAAAV